MKNIILFIISGIVLSGCSNLNDEYMKDHFKIRNTNICFTKEVKGNTKKLDEMVITARQEPCSHRHFYERVNMLDLDYVLINGTTKYNLISTTEIETSSIDVDGVKHAYVSGKKEVYEYVKETNGLIYNVKDKLCYNKQGDIEEEIDCL